MMERGRGSDKVLRSLRKLVVSVPNYATRLMKKDTNKKAMKCPLGRHGRRRTANCCMHNSFRTSTSLTVTSFIRKISFKFINLLLRFPFQFSRARGKDERETHVGDISVWSIKSCFKSYSRIFYWFNLLCIGVKRRSAVAVEKKGKMSGS